MTLQRPIEEFGSDTVVSQSSEALELTAPSQPKEEVETMEMILEGSLKCLSHC